MERHDVAVVDRRSARRWVRAHWADFMWSADVPDLEFGGNEIAADLVADVFCEESRKLSMRIEPKLVGQ